MKRTQIFLTEAQRKSLKALEAVEHRSMGELIRDAVDQMLEQRNPDWKAGLLSAAGLWEERKDLPDFQALREELDR